MREAWRLIRSGHVSAAYNMAIDEAMMHQVVAGGQPTLRLYGWEPAAVSVGYFQDVSKEVDEQACASLGIDVVRRLTGGRAILHDVEVTYSLVIPEDHPLVPRGITESYRIISEGLVRGLEILGLDARMTTPSRYGRRRQNERETISSPACFDAPSWYEITIDGKKVVGSAQVRKCGALLQHGSIPLELDAEKLFTVLHFPNETMRERAKRVFLANATSVRDALRAPVSFLELSDALLAGLEETLPIRFVEGELTEEELKTAEHLVETRYGTPEWNQRRPVRAQGQLA